MSVLVEAQTLVVRRLTLDFSYPGGTEAWVERLREPGHSARYVSADSRLVGASFLTRDIESEIEHLREAANLVDFEDGEWQEVAVVDQAHGLEWPCSWLVFERLRGEGDKHWRRYGHCWLRSTNPGILAVPAGWVPGGEGLVLTNPRSRAGLQRLAREDDREHWLDLKSGRLLVFPVITGDEDPWDGPIMARARGWMVERGLDWDVGESGMHQGELAIGHMKARLIVQALEAEHRLSAIAILPLLVPPRFESQVLDRLNRRPGRFRVHESSRMISVQMIIALEPEKELPTPELMEQTFGQLRTMARGALEVWFRFVAQAPDEWGIDEQLRGRVPTPEAKPGDSDVDAVAVREAVAGNPSIPEDLRIRLSGDPDPRVRQATAGPGGSPMKPGEEPLKRSPPERPSVFPELESEEVGPEALRDLARTADPPALLEIARHPSAPPDLLRALVRLSGGRG